MDFQYDEMWNPLVSNFFCSFYHKDWVTFTCLASFVFVCSEQWCFESYYEVYLPFHIRWVLVHILKYPLSTCRCTWVFTEYMYLSIHPLSTCTCTWISTEYLYMYLSTHWVHVHVLERSLSIYTCTWVFTEYLYMYLSIHWVHVHVLEYPLSTCTWVSTEYLYTYLHVSIHWIHVLEYPLSTCTRT